MKIPNKKVEGNSTLNGQNPVSFNSFWAKYVVFPLNWNVLAEILDLLRNFMAENRKKLRK